MVLIKTHVAKSGRDIFKCCLCEIENITGGLSLLTHVKGKKHQKKLMETGTKQLPLETLVKGEEMATFLDQKNLHLF